jgi:hypothetical protein
MTEFLQYRHKMIAARQKQAAIPQASGLRSAGLAFYRSQAIMGREDERKMLLWRAPIPEKPRLS